MEIPQLDEIELSIFGPGYGECIIIHIGDGNWIVVDSCIDPEKKKTAAVEYFSEIGIDLESVKLIVVTHWHDDHIRGISELIKICKNAKIVMPAAFCEDKFLDLASLYHDKDELGVSEFTQIWAHLLNEKRIPKFALGTRTIYSYKNNELKLNCRIDSLSPSDAAIILANNGLSKLLPVEPKKKELPKLRRRIRALEPNHTAVVLLISINDIQILLGSDLEVTKDENTGWLAILNSEIDCDAKIFKIPHHGSSNGDHPLIWKNMLQPDPITVTTPFVNGDKKIPEIEDIKRITSLSGKAFLTSEPKSKNSKTEHFIDKMMKADVKRRKLVNPYFGHIRFRSNLTNQDWQTVLSEKAVQLK